MNWSLVIPLLAGMMAVTYIPRLIPFLFVDKMHITGKLKKFLSLIPYTAMAALIFPGVLTTDTSRPEIGIIGGAVAGVLAWRKVPMIFCVLAAIAADFALYLIPR
ncbi:MAG: AzlD domain-containing protein [Treponemataceae bacterium]|nr:AzlD domain-containing protein [Treponemataceae bacterium]